MIIAQHVAPAAGRRADSPRYDHIRIRRVNDYVAALRTSHGVAVAPRDSPLVRPRWHADCTVVLLRPIHSVWELRVGRHMVELRRHLVIYRGECLATVVADARPSIVSLYHPARVSRVNPQVVVVPVRRVHLYPCLAAVNRLPCRIVQHPSRICILWVREDVLVVPRTALQVTVVRHKLPCVAVVVRPEHARLTRLNRGIYAPRLSR